jgi:hypothetical protein
VSRWGYVPYAMAGIAYPWRLEQTHAMLIGTTGAAKRRSSASW